VLLELVLLDELLYKTLEEFVSFETVTTGASIDKQLCPLLSLISDHGITIPVASWHKRVCKTVAL